MTLRVETYDDVIRLRMSNVASRTVGLDVSAYVVRGVMIDTGFRRVRRALLAAARDTGVRGAIVTHWHEDHAGNAPELVAMGIPVVMRDDTTSILRTRPPIRLYRRVVWGWPPPLAVVPAAPTTFDVSELECVHTPGHSTDHQVVWDPTTRTVFSGDLWLGIRARVLHASEDPYQIIESLHRVAALEPERMFDAHRGLVADPRAALRVKIDWLGGTLATIEDRLRRGETDRQILADVLGGEEMAAIISQGDYARRNLISAVRRRIERIKD